MTMEEMEVIYKNPNTIYGKWKKLVGGEWWISRENGDMIYFTGDLCLWFYEIKFKISKWFMLMRLIYKIWKIKPIEYIDNIDHSLCPTCGMIYYNCLCSHEN